MKKYCLSYDAKDSEELSGNKLKEKVVRILVQYGATSLKNPVASTITFEDIADSNRITHWRTIINNYLGNDIHFYLCLVARTQNGNNIEVDSGDSVLEINFKLMIDGL